MKHLRIALLLFTIPTFLHAQIAECGNVISTDPRNPSNADRPEMENTFYWFPHNGDNHANFDFLTKGGITYTGITNPFWAFTTTLPVGQLFGQDESDFYPEDGWELLKVNFGYLLDGSPRIDPPAMPYMALYNKYTGTIRFLGMWPNQSTAYNIIRFKIFIPQKLVNPNDSGIDVFLDATNLLSVQGDAIQPLDQQTEETVYEVITKFPGISNASYFYWFDLPVAFDPCICLNEVALQMETSVESTWNIEIEGKFDGQIIQKGVQNGSNPSSLFTSNIIGAAGATLATIVTGGHLLNTGTLSGVIDIFQAKPDLPDGTETGLNMLEALNSSAGAFFDDDTQHWIDPNSTGSIGKSEWDKLFMGFGSFLNIGLNFAQPELNKPKPRTIMLGNLTASGTATLEDPTGDVVYWGLPGSELSDQLEQEVDVEGGVVYPEYPFYDKPLGTLALLKTPELKIKKTSHFLKLNHESPIVMGDECGGGLFQYHEIYFQEEDFKFYFNPEMNIDHENTEILASIVIQPKPEYIDNLVYQPVCCDPPNTDLTLNEVQLTVCGNQNNIDLSTELSIGKNFIKGADEYAIYTPPVPLDFINELDAGFLTYSIADILTEYDIHLRLNVSFISNDLGKDLKPIRNNQVLTFPVSPTITNTSPDYDSYDLANNPIRSDVWGQWDTEVLDEGYNFYDDYIQIVGNLSSPAGATSSLISTSVIHLKPGAHISNSIRMAIDYPFEGLYPQDEVASTYVSAFCQNNVPDIQYQANQFAATAPQFDPNLQYFNYLYNSLDDNYSHRLFISPNPAREFLTLRSSQLDMSSIIIHDLSGRPIEQKNLPDQTRQYQMDLADIAPGTYIVRVDCGDEVLSQKLVVTR